MIDLDGLQVLTHLAKLVSGRTNVWFAPVANQHPMIDIHNGVWWTEDRLSAVSLAKGRDLHAGERLDFETYWLGERGGPGDICCHSTFEGAEACALLAIDCGRWCSSEDVSDLEVLTAVRQLLGIISE